MRWLILLLFMSQTLYAGDISTVEPAGLRHKLKDPEKLGEWVDPPDIVVCSTAPVSLKQIKRAVKFWEKLGYNFGSITIALHNNYQCAIGEAGANQIMIDIPSQSFFTDERWNAPTKVGLTRLFVDTNTNTIFKAKIEIMSNWGGAQRILEHELGHALGWKDWDQIGHIMHSNWSQGGYNTKGLKNL